MANTPLLEFSASRLFASWLAQQRVSLAFTTYQAGKLFFIGLTADGRISGFERSFARCMGLWSDGQTIWLSSLFQIWRLENTYAHGEVQDGFDRLYVPQVGYVTGDVDVHDMAVDEKGRLVFANTLFSCLATVSERYSFEPIWQPSFITRLAPEDRCHLNGLAMRGGRPAYVTACSQSDVVEGWRTARIGGGCVIDVESNEVVCDGLSMPHSPRWHNDQLWLLDTGSGYLGRVNFARTQIRAADILSGFLSWIGVLGQICDCWTIQVPAGADLCRVAVGGKSEAAARRGFMWFIRRRYDHRRHCSLAAFGRSHR